MHLSSFGCGRVAWGLAMPSIDIWNGFPLVEGDGSNVFPFKNQMLCNCVDEFRKMIWKKS